MNNILYQALSLYDINAEKTDAVNKDSDAFKITDDVGKCYFLKIYAANDYDIIPGERVYHTLEQIHVETEILQLLSDSSIKVQHPIQNKNGELVTTVGDTHTTMTSFIDGATLSKTSTEEEAYLLGQTVAKLHLESQKKLQDVAKKRPYKRQEYIEKIRTRLMARIKIGTLTAEQFKMLGECCDVVLNCMNKLDKNMERNVGLVHTDIKYDNCISTQNDVALVDFSRSVYSYYLYDLAHAHQHSDACGGNPETQMELLRGYHSVKPLTKEDFFMMQVFFVMFLMMLMAENIESNIDGLLMAFSDKFHPGLISGKGYIESSRFEGITT